MPPSTVRRPSAAAWRGAISHCLPVLCDVVPAREEDSGSRMLVHLQRDGLLEYGEEGAQAAPALLPLIRCRLCPGATAGGDEGCWKILVQGGGVAAPQQPSKWVSQASGRSQPVVLRVPAAR